MKKRPAEIADSFIIAIIIHIYLGWGFLYLTDTAVGHLSNNAYLGIFPALLVILPFFAIAFDLARLYPHQKISAIFDKVFGSFGGKAIALIYLCFLFFFLAIAQRNTQLMIHSYFFHQTPLWLISLLFLGGTLYSALPGVKSVGRLGTFMLIPPLALIFILELLGLNNISLVNAQPVLAGSAGQWLAAVLDLTLVLLPGTAIFVYLPYIQSGKSIFKIGLISLAIAAAVFGLALFGTIGVFGPGLIPKMNWSLVEYFHLIDYPYLFLEQAGLFFLIAWYPFHFVGTAQGLFVIGNELNCIFPRIKRQYFTIAIAILTFTMVNLPINFIDIGEFLKNYHRPLSFSYLGLLLGTWLIARLRSLPGK
jgi:Spore germination protein.